MRVCSKLRRGMERGFLVLGLLFLAIFSLAYIHRFVSSHAAMTEFDAKQLESSKQLDGAVGVGDGASHTGRLHRTRNIDSSGWTAQRTESRQSNLAKPSDALAVLRIPRLRVEVPVLEGTDEFTLNRGIGRIAGTAKPGQNGNIGIAGHRDGFFRPLKDIRTGDLIELVTTSGTDVYAVDQVMITAASDVSVLEPRPKPSLTLVTCYPFYFIGPAPRRYVVEASLRQFARVEE